MTARSFFVGHFLFLFAAVCTAQAADPAPATPARPQPGGDATDLLNRAREARAIWEDFPGFEAELSIVTPGHRANGTVRVSRGGDVEFEGMEGIDVERLTPRLTSLIQHRLGSGDPSEEVVYTEQQGPHPLGRLLAFPDDVELNSAYRVRGDVVAEVNRAMGPNKFTISVLSVYRNAEDKYLPVSYAVSFWNASGALDRVETHLNQWRRVGEFDLPSRVVIVSSTGEGNDSMEFVFRNHKLQESEQ